VQLARDRAIAAIESFVGERQYPDFAFTHQLSPELAPPGWRPQYVDYLILGLTTSTAFGPTDGGSLGTKALEAREPVARAGNNDCCRASGGL
jgi:hypothetical protein